VLSAEKRQSVLGGGQTVSRANLLANPALQARIARVFGPEKLGEMLAGAPSPIGRRREEGDRGAPPKRDRGDNKGRTLAGTARALQRASLQAQLTASLKDNLAVARREEAFHRDRLAKVKEGTETYNRVLADLVSAHGVREAIEQSIAAEKERHVTAVETARTAAGRARPR